jgi:hypothetical protein
MDGELTEDAHADEETENDTRESCKSLLRENKIKNLKLKNH